MKTTLILLLALSLIVSNVYSQISNSYSMNLSKDRFYNKNTHERLRQSEIIQLLKTNPRIVFEPVIDKFGEVESYLVDPYKSDNSLQRDTSNRVKKNESFPPFVMRTIDNKLLDSESLKGKIILLQFNLVFRPPFFDKKAITDFNDLIKELQNISDLVSIIVTESSKEEILEQIGSEVFILGFVPNGRNFNIRYSNVEFPSFILVDKNGHLVSYYDFGNFRKIKSDFLKIK